jgi:hypothetical protein
MQAPFIKIKENLFINDKSVFSYNTHVADIVGKEIIEIGKFSRTTTRHISDVAWAIGGGVKDQGKLQKVYFFKYEMGVKCLPSNCLSNKTSREISLYLKAGKTYFQALCMVRGEKIKDQDKELIDRYLESFGDPEGVQLVMDLAKIS